MSASEILSNTNTLNLYFTNRHQQTIQENIIIRAAAQIFCDSLFHSLNNKEAEGGGGDQANRMYSVVKWLMVYYEQEIDK